MCIYKAPLSMLFFVCAIRQAHKCRHVSWNITYVTERYAESDHRYPSLVRIELYDTQYYIPRILDRAWVRKHARASHGKKPSYCSLRGQWHKFDTNLRGTHSSASIHTSFFQKIKKEKKCASTVRFHQVMFHDFFPSSNKVYFILSITW